MQGLDWGDKNSVRSYFARLRREFCRDLDKKAQAESRIGHLLQKLLEPFRAFAGYRARGAEVNIDAVAWQEQKVWSFPRIEGRNLRFYRADHVGEFEKGSFEIDEPKAGLVTQDVGEVDAILIPGVAFDRQGQRLGYGKGFYDRALSHTKALKVGVAFQCQVANESLPIISSDIPMDYVVTDQFILKPERGVS